MELMDRDHQRGLLQRLSAVYPRALGAQDFGAQLNDVQLLFSAAYLHDHGLITLRTEDTQMGPLFISGRATAAGLDFLQDDGGLTALLGVVTVRLDAETIRGLIGDKIDTADIPLAEKSTLRKWLDTASSDMLKEATKRLVGAALDHAPQALQLLQTLRG